MAVLYATSFEGGSVAYYSQNGWAVPTFTIHTGAGLHLTSGGLGGSYAMQISGFTSLAARTPAAWGTAGRWIHFAHTPLNPGSPLVNYFAFEISTNAQFRVKLNASGSIELQRGTTTVATSVGSVNRAVQHWFAIQLLAANVGGVCEVWVDGVLMVSFAGDTQNNVTLADWDTVRWTDSLTFSEYIIDDFIVTDSTTGRVAEQFCQVMLPDAVDSGNLTGVSAVGADRWQNIDEGGPNGPTTQATYNEAAAVNDEDLYTLTAPATPTAVLCAVVWLEASRVGAITAIEATIDSNGTPQVFSPSTLPTSGFESLPFISETDPDTGVAWTSTGLNGMKAGAKFT